MAQVWPRPRALGKGDVTGRPLMEPVRKLARWMLDGVPTLTADVGGMTDFLANFHHIRDMRIAGIAVEDAKPADIMAYGWRARSNALRTREKV